jgi:hypothetical protein
MVSQKVKRRKVAHPKTEPCKVGIVVLGAFYENDILQSAEAFSIGQIAPSLLYRS